MESILDIQQAEKSNSHKSTLNAGIPLTASENLIDEDKGLESRIGRYGLASMGNIVLFFGISFLAQYLMNKGQPLISAIIGYSAALGYFYWLSF